MRVFTRAKTLIKRHLWLLQDRNCRDCPYFMSLLFNVLAQ